MGESTIVAWQGPVYALQPQEPQKYMFDVYGINLARCWWNHTESQYYFSSRELQYYLGPDDTPLNIWTNPWTNETLNVVHTANDPVQFAVGTADDIYYINGDNQATFEESINLYYENPLQCTNDPTYHQKSCDLTVDEKIAYRPYSHQPMYESTELFKFFVDESAMKDPAIDSAPLHFAWTRISQFMPWMKVDETIPGSLLFTAHGGKIDYSQVPQWLKTEIEDRIPAYRHSPACFEAGSSVTSWTYFRKYFDEYQEGQQFPIPAEVPVCEYDVVTEDSRRPGTISAGEKSVMNVFVAVCLLLASEL